MTIEEVPVMQLAPQGIGPGKVYVSDAVRQMMNDWMLERFGVVPGITERDGTLYVDECWSCGRRFEWYGEADDYDPNLHESNVCGGSEWCIP